jgi:hypothetical protein
LCICCGDAGFVPWRIAVRSLISRLSEWFDRLEDSDGEVTGLEDSDGEVTGLEINDEIRQAWVADIPIAKISAWS